MKKNQVDNFFICEKSLRTSGLCYKLFCGGYLFISLFIPSNCVAKINVKKSSSTIHVADGAGFIEDGKISDFKGKLIKDSGGTVSGGTITFNNGTYDDSGNKVKMTGELNLDAIKEIVLNGNEIFKGKRGSVVEKLKIKGKKNRLEGLLQLTNLIELFDKEATMTCALQGRVPCNIALNGGSIFLEEDLHFVDDSFFTGSGIIKVNKRKVKFGSKEITCDASIYFDDACDVELNANMHLSETWTFSGTNILLGNNKIL